VSVVAPTASVSATIGDLLRDEEEVILLFMTMMLDERAHSGRPLEARFIYDSHGRIEAIELVSGGGMNVLEKALDCGLKLLVLGPRPAPASEAEQAGDDEQAGAGLGDHREAETAAPSSPVRPAGVAWRTWNRELPAHRDRWNCSKRSANTLSFY
jgi:hypothetical protein